PAPGRASACGSPPSLPGSLSAIAPSVVSLPTIPSRCQSRKALTSILRPLNGHNAAHNPAAGFPLVAGPIRSPLLQVPADKAVGGRALGAAASSLALLALASAVGQSFSPRLSPIAPPPPYVVIALPAPAGSAPAFARRDNRTTPRSAPKEPSVLLHKSLPGRA